MTNETAAPSSERGFRRMSRNFFGSGGGGGDASTSASSSAQPRPPGSESGPRPLTVRAHSDQQVPHTHSASGPSTMRAADPVPRASTFGTFFRTPTAGGSASAGPNGPPAQQRPPRQGRPSSSGIVTSQLPPPLPNPYDSAHAPAMPAPNGIHQSRPHSSHLPLSAPAQGQHPVPGGYGAQQNGSMHLGHSPHHQPPYDRPLPPHPQRYSMQGYPTHFQPPTTSSAPHTPQHLPNAPLAAPPQAVNNPDADQLEAVLQASRATADEEKRKRDDDRLAEEAHYLALHESEQAERRRKEAEEEERMMLKVIEESEREEREAQAKRIERQREEEAHSQVLLEESRQLALREDEERLRKQHAALLAQSKQEAEMAELKRRQAEAEQKSMEETAMRESLREMEEEWRRRDEEERAVAAHMQHGGRLGAPSYWQQLDQKKAYNLAVKMDNRTPAREPASSRFSAPSHPRRPLPLPPTPVQAALAAGLENQKPAQRKSSRDPDALQEEEDHEDEVWMQSDDELMQDGRSNSGDDNEDDDSVDPFGDDAEAPPTYDEIREDRPPEAPTSIPGHIQFAPMTASVQVNHNNTLSNFPDIRSEKSAAVSATHRENPLSTTPQLPEPSTSADRRGERRNMPLPPPPLSTEALAPGNGSSDHAMRPSDSVDSAEVGPSPSPSPSQAPVTAPRNERDEGSLSIHQSLPSPSPSTQGQESPAEFQQRAMKGTDFGYSNEPFGTTLELANGEKDKSYFPTSILLQKLKTDGSLASPSCFFSVRAPSWKALLRALAWYGNTRIEAGPEDIADHPDGIPLRIEVEFVTPSKVDASVGMRNAHVGVCFSLAYPSLADATSKNLRASLKNASRALDSAYVRQGATRRVIALPSQAPILPLAIVRLAQHMHRAHKFSAACPSTGHTALHSPRDLHHAVERHDVGFVAKMQRKLREQGAQQPGLRVASSSGVGGGANEGMPGRAGVSSAESVKGRSEGTAAGPSQGGAADSPQSSRFSMSFHRPSMSSVVEEERAGVDGEGRPEGGAQQVGNSAVHDEDDDGGDESFIDDELDAGAVEIADGTDRDASRMARMRARVYRRLAKRSGDSRTVDEDLESWITPYDLTQHG